MKTAIVVSGGDAPGINAAIDCYARLAARKGDQVVGALGGFVGLLNGRLAAIDLRSLQTLVGRGGSILPSSRSPVLQESDARVRLQAVVARHRIDNLLLFGGDGTIRFAGPLLEAWGIPHLVLPTTIDNDVPGTDYTLGHDSACNFAIQAVEGIRATATALPGRIFMLETLGAPTGHLALAIAYASGAHLALLPEYPLELDWLASRLKRIVAQEGYALVLLSEAYPQIDRLVAEIPERAGIRIRYSALGHAQRGADASQRDRVVARDMSRVAYCAFKAGAQGGLVVSRAGAVLLHPGRLPGGDKPPPDRDLYEFVNQL
ncbi:MAG: 6-phosphofructokinase [Chloroflexi bacterium]|nr:6-phosphofructokinase [Chloroflexota bacterium]